MKELPTLAVEQSDADLVEEMIRATITHTLPEKIYHDRIRDHGRSCAFARQSDFSQSTDSDVSRRRLKQLSGVDIPLKEPTRSSPVDEEQVMSDSVFPESAEDNPPAQTTTSLAPQGLTASATAKPPASHEKNQSRFGIPERKDTAPSALSVEDIAIFLDLDLSILAAQTTIYRRYMNAIRKEYSHFSNSEYREGRHKVLEGFMDRKELYFSMLAKIYNWDVKARENIRMELNFLSSTAETK
jgi:predicted metal-dependent HD superfamily phosphohydrolase